MEEQFIIALANRSKSEAGLIDQLPDDVKLIVSERLLSQEIQDAVIVEQNEPAL
jgi:hypothetical protein